MIKVKELLESLDKFNEEETWKDYFGRTIKVGDTVVRFKSGQFYLYKGKVLGLATTPGNAKHGYIRIELDESPDHVLYKEEAGKIITCDPKNTLLYN